MGFYTNKATRTLPFAAHFYKWVFKVGRVLRIITRYEKII